MVTNLCPHSDEQRTMTGTWCTPELQKTVEKGYLQDTQGS